MFYAIKFAPLTAGPNTVVDFPSVVGPFATAEEQKTWIRAEHAQGRRACWLDVRTEVPTVGLTLTVDGGRDLCGTAPTSQKSARENAVWDAIFAATFAAIWSMPGTDSVNFTREEAKRVADVGLSAWRDATSEGSGG